MSDEKTKRSEELAVGDVVAGLLGKVDGRLMAIEPYSGPLTDIVMAIGTFVPGGRYSLCHGVTWTVLS